MYGERGSPCLHPRPMLKNEERWPYWRTASFACLYRMSIHVRKDGPKIEKF